MTVERAICYGMNVVSFNLLLQIYTFLNSFKCKNSQKGTTRIRTLLVLCVIFISITVGSQFLSNLFRLVPKASAVDSLSMINDGFENDKNNWWNWDPSNGSWEIDTLEKHSGSKSTKIQLGTGLCSDCGNTHVSCINQGRHIDENSSMWQPSEWTSRAYYYSYWYKTTPGVTTNFQVALRKADGNYVYWWYPDGVYYGSTSTNWYRVGKIITIPASIDGQSVTAMDVSVCVSTPQSGPTGEQAIAWIDDVVIANPSSVKGRIQGRRNQIGSVTSPVTISVNGVGSYNLPTHWDPPYSTGDVLPLGNSYNVSTTIPTGQKAYYSICNNCIDHPDNSYIEGSQLTVTIPTQIADNYYTGYVDLYWKYAQSNNPTPTLTPSPSSIPPTPTVTPSTTPSPSSIPPTPTLYPTATPKLIQSMAVKLGVPRSGSHPQGLSLLLVIVGGFLSLFTNR